MNMPGRSFNSSTYNYSFNGKLDDAEVEGQQDYGFRIYDKRLARFKSVDPLTKKFAMLTPYQFASNTPIQAIDMDGLEAIMFTIKQWKNSDGKTQQSVNTAYDVGKKGDERVLTVVHNLDNGKTQEMLTSPIEVVGQAKGQSFGQKTENFLYSLDKALPKGSIEAYNDNASYEGEAGMLKGADVIDNTGTLFKATVIGAPLGEGLSIMSDIMKTGLDFKNKDSKTALKNTFIRGLSLGAGKTLDKSVDLVKGVSKSTKEAVKITNDKLLDTYKDNATENPKEPKGE